MKTFINTIMAGMLITLFIVSSQQPVLARESVQVKKVDKADKSFSQHAVDMWLRLVRLPVNKYIYDTAAPVDQFSVPAPQPVNRFLPPKPVPVDRYATPKPRPVDRYATPKPRPVDRYATPKPQPVN